MIAAASAFVVNAGHAPNAVRLALAAPAEDVLAEGLDVVRRIALAGADQSAIE